MELPTTFYLHVGQSKTGTTTLQRSLFRRHPDIFYLGQYVPSKISKHCLSEEVYQFLRPLLWDTAAPLNVDRSREQLARIHAAEGATDRRWVASWEELSHFPPHRFREMIQRVQAVFGDCRMLLTLRNPLNRIPSEYLENLKGHFIKGAHPWMGEMPYLDIEQWLHRASAGEYLANMLSYGSSVQEAVRILGVDQVGIFLFEDLRASPDRYYSQLFRFLAVDPDRGRALTENEHLHPRVTQSGVEFLRRLNDSPIQRIFLKLAKKKYRKALFARKSQGASAEHVVLPPAWASRIAAATSQGHRWMAETFGLAIAKHGYPMELPARSSATMVQPRGN